MALSSLSKECMHNLIIIFTITLAEVDYAHESTGFPTWHRQYLLWLEWELQYMLNANGYSNYYMFQLHYWDWRKNKQTNANLPFKSNRLGVTMDNDGSGRPIVDRR